MAIERPHNESSLNRNLDLIFYFFYFPIFTKKWNFYRTNFSFLCPPESRQRELFYTDSSDLFEMPQHEYYKRTASVEQLQHEWNWMQFLEAALRYVSVIFLVLSIR